MAQPTTDRLSLKTWVRDRIVFLAVIIFFFGGVFYIGAGKYLDPQNEWLHPIKEFALLLSLVGMPCNVESEHVKQLTFRIKRTLPQI